MIKSFEIACAGYSIKADWYEGKKADTVVLVLQGFASDRSRQADFTDHLVKTLGVSALVIDYSGHGDSPFELKDTRPAQHLLEAVYAFDWITTNYPNSNVIVIGNSYGSFLASHLSFYRAISTIILRAPAIYEPSEFYNLWLTRFANEDAYRESIVDYRSDAVALRKSHLFTGKVKNIPAHALVVVHELDEVIPRQTSDAYIQAFEADNFIAHSFKHAVSQSDVSKEQITDYYNRITDWLSHTYLG